MNILTKYCPDNAISIYTLGAYVISADTDPQLAYKNNYYVPASIETTSPFFFLSIFRRGLNF